MLSLHRMNWAIVEELHRNIADGDILKTYTKSPRYWKTQHFFNPIALYTVGVPTPLAGNQQIAMEAELNRLSHSHHTVLFPSIQKQEHFLGEDGGVRNFKNLKGYTS